MQAQGIDVWQAIVNGYNVPATPPIDNAGRKLHDGNSKAMNAILSGMVESIFMKVMHCESTMEIWDKPKNIYEGDEKVKGEKLQTYRGQFEHLKMKEEENIAAYFLQVYEVVNIIIGLGGEIEGSVIAQKILRSLPMRFDSKISAIEERSDMGTMTVNELHGILTAYEMRIEQEDS